VRPDGRIGPVLNSTFWGALALHAAGRPVPAATAVLIRRTQGSGGGWSWHAKGRPDADDTAAALLALKAAGATARDPAVRRGLAFLARLRNSDGGTTADPGGDSNAQSTAWAIQAHRAFGRAPASGALAYLARLQQPDGSVRFSTDYATTPVWVTAYAVVAASGRWYPVAGR
jgi:hypothetical protein